MAQEFLHYLGREATAAALLRVDAPAGEEVPEGVHCILWLNDSIPALVERGLALYVQDRLHDPCGDHYRCQSAQDLFVVGYSAIGSRKHEVASANRAGELPGLQGRQ